MLKFPTIIILMVKQNYF